MVQQSGSGHVESIAGFVRTEQFPCVGAKAALAKETMQFLEAEDIRESCCDEKIVAALQSFARGTASASSFHSLVVLFPIAPPMTEVDFERFLWRRLWALHQIDHANHPWDHTVSFDPGNANFAMSYGGQGFYVVGLHPGASRAARRTPFPVIAFIPHAQFRSLRAAGSFEKLRTLRWSPSFGQVGGLIKLFPGSFYAASLMDIVSGACPGYGTILSTR